MVKREPVVPRLMLDTKIAIPFPSAQISIYQPSILEIAFIGEASLIIGCNALIKDYKSFQDNSDLSQFSNFQILMRMINDKSVNAKKVSDAIRDVFFLIFPNCKVTFTPMSIIIQDEEKQTHIIDDNNFESFLDIIYDIFCLAELTQNNTTEDYNPLGDRARAIVEKFKKKHEFLAQQRKENGEYPELMSIFGRYIDILAVGEHKDKNILKQYSVYQLVEEFTRFIWKQGYDTTFEARLAGATKLKDPKDWTSEFSLGNNHDDD